MSNLDQQNEQIEEADAEETPEQSSSSEPSIETVLSRFTEEMDKRYAGFQSLLDKKISPLSRQLSQLQKASLSPEEQEEEEAESAAKELENLRMEVQLYRLRTEHPDAVDLIIGAMKTSSLDEQIAFIESKIGKQVVQQIEQAQETSSQSQSSEGETVPNPGTKPKVGSESARFAGAMTDEIADSILASAPRGSLVGKR